MKVGVPCFVYAIGMVGDVPMLQSALKIGIARKPENRISGLSTGNPYRLEIRKTWKFNSDDDARDFERACHIEFRTDNILREWFSVTVEQIDDFFESFITASDVARDAEDLIAAIGKARINGGAARRPPKPTYEESPSRLLDTAEAAAYIKKSPSWLNKSRMTGTGPVYMKNGGNIRYQVRDLEIWMERNRRTAVYDFANNVTY